MLSKFEKLKQVQKILKNFLNFFIQGNEQYCDDQLISNPLFFELKNVLNEVFGFKMDIKRATRRI